MSFQCSWAEVTLAHSLFSALCCIQKFPTANNRLSSCCRPGTALFLPWPWVTANDVCTLLLTPDSHTRCHALPRPRGGETRSQSQRTRYRRQPAGRGEPARLVLGSRENRPSLCPSMLPGTSLVTGDFVAQVHLRNLRLTLNPPSCLPYPAVLPSHSPGSLFPSREEKMCFLPFLSWASVLRANGKREKEQRGAQLCWKEVLGLSLGP